MGKKPRQWSPDGLKYLMVVNPFAWRNPPDGNSSNVNPGHLIAWINHALGFQEGDSVVQELAWRAKTGTSEAILVGISESMDIKDLLGEHRWSEFGRSLKRQESSYIFETKYESLAHACGADSWKRVESDLQPAGVGDMFKEPYPRPYWADSKKQCAGMKIQVSAQVKPMQAIPRSELPVPSISRPPPAVDSAFGPSECKAEVAQGVDPSPRGASSQGSPHVKQEISENLVQPPIPVSRSSSTLPNTPAPQIPFPTEPEQSDNRRSNTPHGAAHTNSIPEAAGNGHWRREPQVKKEVSEGPVASVEQATAAYAAYLARRSIAQASIPTASFTRALSLSPRSAQAQSRETPFPVSAPPLSSTPETPTTHVKTEPLGHTFETASPANTNQLESVVSVNISSSGVSLPATKFEFTATVPSPAITRSETLFTPEESNRFSVKTEPIDLSTDLMPPVMQLGTSSLTERHSQAQTNVTVPLNPKIESGTDDRSTILALSSTLNKRKNASTGDRDRLSKRAKLGDSSR